MVLSDQLVIIQSFLTYLLHINIIYLHINLISYK